MRPAKPCKSTGEPLRGGATLFTMTARTLTRSIQSYSRQAPPRTSSYEKFRHRAATVEECSSRSLTFNFFWLLPARRRSELLGRAARADGGKEYLVFKNF